ncbi:MAG: dNTP triphosphohydrolase [Candidatus Gracilibacteria bacterium]
MIYTKEELERLEAERLAPYAVKSMNSKGRKFEEDSGGGSAHGDAGGGDAGASGARGGGSEKSGRLCFQKDKDRIIHCKAFRRLDEKTQVFPAFVGDHYRTRLTHTLEVAQISRDICRRLGLNEDLAEAIALAHDLGHPPFGHAGEEALNEIVTGGFEHNNQSQRVVEKLEKLYPDFDGLNLSLEVLEGLAKHQTSWDRGGEVGTEGGKSDDADGAARSSASLMAAHLEGQVVNLADEIAYTNHDMDDGLRSGILQIEDLDGAALWKEAYGWVSKKYGNIPSSEVRISRIISSIIYFMITDIVGRFDEVVVKFSDGMVEKIRELREILFKKFYLSETVKTELDKGRMMIRKLFKYYVEHPERVPEKYRRGESFEVAVKDYIAGMTDRFLEKEVAGIDANEDLHRVELDG